MRLKIRMFLLAAALLLSVSGCDFFRQLDAAGRAQQDGLPADPNDLLPTPEPLEGLSAGLSALDSYRASLTLELRSAAGAAPLETISILQEVNRSQDQLHYRLAKEGNPTTAAVFEYFQLGPELYLYTEQGGADAGCDRMTSQQSTLSETTQALTPEDVFGAIYLGQPVARGETVNGLAADHYSVNLQRMGLSSSPSQVGDAWIAQSGGYVVRFSGEAQGVILGFDTAAQNGVSSWSYDLEQVNQLSSIQLSPVCQQAQQLASEFPVPAGASAPATYGGVTTLTLPQSVREAADFYLTSLGEAGWQVTERMTLERLVILDISRQGLRMEITITQTEQGSSVLIQER